MEPKKSKYDTNPLDPDFVKKSEESRGEESRGEESRNPVTQDVKGGATREMGSSANENARGNVYSEAPTRRYDNLPLDSPYQSVFVPPTYSQPAPYQPSPAPYRPVVQAPTSRTVAALGLPEKWAIMLPYAPAIGLVVSLIELFLVPKTEPRVRFHASQGLALHLAILVVQTLFGVVGAITDSSAGGSLFRAASVIFLIISMIRVWKGEPHYIAPLSEPAKWLEEKIKLRTKR
jgi:uncharacterized membrane protein